MKRELELVKNTIIIAFGTIFPKFAALITLPIITGQLTKAELGTYDLISTLVSLYLPIVTLQIQSAAFRFLLETHENKDIQEIISTIMIFIFCTSIIAEVIMFIVLDDLNGKTRFLIGLYFFVDIFLGAEKQIARGLHKNKIYSISTIIVSISNMLFIILMLLIFSYGLDGAVFSLFMATLLSTLVLGYKLRICQYIKIKCVSGTLLKKMLKYSWPMIPNSLSSWVMNLSDRVVVTSVLGIEANAIYSVANKLPNLFTSVQSTFVLAWQENASVASKDDDIEEYYTKMFDSVFRILFAIMACLIAITPLLFSILIKGDYEQAYAQIPILYIAMLFSSISSFMGGIYVALKLTVNIGVTTIVAACINLAVNIFAIRYIGLYAASLSTLISFGILSIYRMINIKKFLSLKYDYPRIFYMILILALMSFLSYGNVFVLNIINIFIALSASIFFNKELIKKVKTIIFRKVYKE